MVVVISIASAVASLNASVVSVGRVSRVTVKLLKLVRTQPLLSRMKSIIETTIASMASMVNIGALLVLLTSVYAVIGMKFFWNILDDGIFNSHANFRTFPMAMLTMFRVATVRSRDFVHILARAVNCGPVSAERQLERHLAQRYGRPMRYPRRRRLWRGLCRRVLLLVCSPGWVLSSEHFVAVRRRIAMATK